MPRLRLSLSCLKLDLEECAEADDEDNMVGSGDLLFHPVQLHNYLNLFLLQWMFCNPFAFLGCICPFCPPCVRLLFPFFVLYVPVFSFSEVDEFSRQLGTN